MVNCLHVSPTRPYASLQTKLRPTRKCFPVVVPTPRVFSASNSYANALSYQFNPLLKHPLRVQCQRTVSPVCLLGGKDKSEGDGEGSSWNPLDKAMEGFKGQSVEDLLRQQMQKQEFYGGGSGQNPPPSGGGGGGGDGSEESDDGLSGAIDETVQVVLATLGFIFLYVYIITGEELLRLAKDYLKYVFGGSQSVRLKKAMYQWKRFLQKFTEKKQVDPFWLERLIINTPTAYDSPQKYRRFFRSYLSSDSDDLD